MFWLRGASILNFYGSSNKRLRDCWYSGKFKDADPADSNHAPEWKERQAEQNGGSQEQIVAVLPVHPERLPAGALQRGLACDPGVRLSEWKERQKQQNGGSQEQIVAVLPVHPERLPAGALQRGLACDPGVRLSCARPCRLRAVVGGCFTEASFVTAVKTHQTKPPSQDRHEDRPEGRVLANHHRPDFACSALRHRGSSQSAVFPFLFHAQSRVHRKGDFGVEADGMKGNTIKLRSDDGGSRKRGVSYGHLARHISQDRHFFKLSLLESL